MGGAGVLHSFRHCQDCGLEESVGGAGMCDLDSVHCGLGESSVGGANKRPTPPTHPHTLPSGSMILTESVQVVSSSG